MWEYGRSKQTKVFGLQFFLRYLARRRPYAMEAPLVQIDTAMGSFAVELYYKHAPNACKNFQELAKRGYYDGTIVSAAMNDY